MPGEGGVCGVPAAAFVFGGADALLGAGVEAGGGVDGLLATVGAGAGAGVDGGGVLGLLAVVVVGAGVGVEVDAVVDFDLEPFEPLPDVELVVVEPEGVEVDGVEVVEAVLVVVLPFLLFDFELLLDELEDVPAGVLWAWRGTLMMPARSAAMTKEATPYVRLTFIGSPWVLAVPATTRSQLRCAEVVGRAALHFPAHVLCRRAKCQDKHPPRGLQNALVKTRMNL